MMLRCKWWSAILMGKATFSTNVTSWCCRTVKERSLFVIA